MRKLRSFLSSISFETFAPYIEKIVFSLAAAFVLILPVFNETMLNRGETVQVLNRIEAMAKAISNHAPVHAPMDGLNFGYGYGSTLFESPLPYYVPALFRSMGMGLQMSMLVYVYLIFARMVKASYGMAKTILRKDRITIYVTALLASASLCAYIMIFCDGDLSSGAALRYIPSIIRAWYDMVNSKGKGWIRLAYATTMCFLSSETYGLFMIILSVIFFITQAKYLFYHRRALLYIFAAGVIFSLLTMWVWLPNLVLLPKGEYLIQTFSGLKGSGAVLHDLLDVIPYSSDHLSNTVGLVLLALPALVFKCKGRTRWKFVRTMTILGYIGLFLTTSMFPWSLFSFAAKMENPALLMPAAGVLLSIGAGYVLSYYPFDAKDRPFIRRCIAGVTAVIIMMMVNTRYHYTGEITRDYTVKELSNDALMIGNTDSFYNMSELADGRYLPVTDYNYRGKKREVKKDGTGLSFVETDGILVCDGAGAGTYLFPKTWYPGYIVTVKEEGKKTAEISTEQDEETGLVRAVVEEDSDGDTKLELSYEKPAVLKACEAFSILFWITFGVAMFLLSLVRFLKRKGMSKNMEKKKETSEIAPAAA